MVFWLIRTLQNWPKKTSSGQYRNPKQQRGYFSTAYFHHPDEISFELKDAGLQVEAILPVEGPGWLTSTLDALWAAAACRGNLCE